MTSESQALWSALLASENLYKPLTMPSSTPCTEWRVAALKGIQMMGGRLYSASQTKAASGFSGIAMFSL